MGYSAVTELERISMPRYGNSLAFTVLAAIAAASSAKADLFSYSGGIVTFDITVTGIYEITVAGASGGGGFRGTSGGLGALVSGDRKSVV